jgi:hypothetical protein
MCTASQLGFEHVIFHSIFVKIQELVHSQLKVLLLRQAYGTDLSVEQLSSRAKRVVSKGLGFYLAVKN